jgi:hypothetical protein
MLRFSRASGIEAFAFLVRMLQRLAHKGVGMSIKTGVLLADEADDFSEF